jgi:hypothetical protein
MGEATSNLGIDSRNLRVWIGVMRALGGRRFEGLSPFDAAGLGFFRDLCLRRHRLSRRLLA